MKSSHETVFWAESSKLYVPRHHARRQIAIAVHSHSRVDGVEQQLHTCNARIL